MLPKNKRLNLRTNFKWVVKGKKIQTSSFTIYLNKGENREALVGVSIAKKNFKKATDRNRVKRLSYLAVTEVYQDLPNNMNMIIMPKIEAINKNLEELKEELKDVKDSFNLN